MVVIPQLNAFALLICNWKCLHIDRHTTAVSLIIFHTCMTCLIKTVGSRKNLD